MEMSMIWRARRRVAIYWATVFLLCGCDDAAPISDAGVDGDASDAGGDVSIDGDTDDADRDGFAESTPTEYVRRRAHPLSTLDPTEPFDDLQSMSASFVDRRIVLLGEGDHGVVESREYKLRFVAFLYLEHGFHTYCEELGVVESMIVNQYIQTGDEAFLDDLDLHDYESYFGAAENFDFFRGLYALNAGRPSEHPPLQFCGFDLDHGMRNAAELVMRYLDAAGATELRTTIEPLIACGTPSVACDEAQANALGLLLDARDSLVLESSPEQFEEARLGLQSLSDTVHYYMLASLEDDSADQFREDVMMEHTDRHLSSMTQGLIVSGHNIHVAKRFSAVDWGWTSLGEHVATSYEPSEVYSLAMTFAQGTHLVRTTLGFDVQSIQVLPEESIEHILASAGLGLFALDFGDAGGRPPGGQWIDEPRGMLMNGFPGYLSVVLSEQWDGVVFIDAVSATSPP